MEKPCTICGERKPLTEFYVQAQMRDGHLNQCKVCCISREKARRRANPCILEYDRARAKTEKRKALAAKNGRRWKLENPEAYKAQTAVGNAIRDGKLAKEPCYFCGSEERIHAHHKDYGKPLDVVWLCAKCHHRLHAIAS